MNYEVKIGYIDPHEKATFVHCNVYFVTCFVVLVILNLKIFVVRPHQYDGNRFQNSDFQQYFCVRHNCVQLMQPFSTSTAQCVLTSLIPKTFTKYVKNKLSHPIIIAQVAYFDKIKVISQNLNLIHLTTCGEWRMGWTSLFQKHNRLYLTILVLGYKIGLTPLFQM